MPGDVWLESVPFCMIGGSERIGWMLRRYSSYHVRIGFDGETLMFGGGCILTVTEEKDRNCPVD